MSLVSDDTNKTPSNQDREEGVEGDFIDILELPMSDEELNTIVSYMETLK